MFRQSLAQLITEKHNEIQFTARCLEVIEDLGLEEFEGYCSSYCNRIDIYVYQYEGVDKDEIMKNVLAKVGKFKKNYKPDARRIDLETMYKGINLSFECAPAATCKIEEYDEIVEVPAKPAEPAKIEVIKKYRYSGDCGPMFAEK